MTARETATGRARKTRRPQPPSCLLRATQARSGSIYTLNRDRITASPLPEWSDLTYLQVLDRHYPEQDAQTDLHHYTIEYWQERARIARRFAQTVAPRLGGDVNALVELGCGAGHFGIELARQLHASKLVGIDLRVLQLSLADRYAQHIRLPAAMFLVHGDLETDPLPLPDDWADLSLMISTFYYIRNKARLVREVARILKPGGIFLVNVYNRAYIRNIHPYLPPLPGFWWLPRSLARRYLRRTGFEEKLTKFETQLHHTTWGYERLLRRAGFQTVRPFLLTIAEYRHPLADHSSRPWRFPSQGHQLLTPQTALPELQRHFRAYRHRDDTLADRLFRALAFHLPLRLGWANLPFWLAPQVWLLAQLPGDQASPIRSRNAASSRTSTPRSRARSSLDPGSAPAMR